MSSLLRERLISLSRAAKQVPGGPVHLSTIHRWRLRGVHGVRLETVVVGGRRMTSIESLARFAERTTAAVDGQAADSKTSQRIRQIRAAERSLDDAGI